MTFSTIRQIIVSAAEKFQDGDAVRYKTSPSTYEAKSYNELRRDSEHFSLVLQELGELGGHIALVGATSYSWMVTYFGIVGSGSVAVPLDVSLPAEDMLELVDRADATVFVVDEIRPDILAMAKAKCPKLKYLISMQKEISDEQAMSLWELINKQEGGFDKPADPDALCTIMFTSGTTGKSKGVMLTQRNLAENATCLDMQIPERSMTLTVLPIHHAYCLSMDILKGLSIGTIICINDSLMRMAKNFQLFQPHITLMVPLMIETFAKKLMDVEGAPAELVRAQVFGPNLHTIYSGGAYLNPDYIPLFKKYGISLMQGYGMTECAPVISTPRPGEERVGSVGKLMPNCEVKIVDEEIWVRGSSVMMGYYQMPKETAETLEDGWLKTGDLGRLDEDNYLYLTGRKKNLIITKNGENVSPEELENKIGEDRLVQEILVREKEGVIEAEIFPDMEYAQKKEITDLRAALQELIDEYNKTAPSYKKVYSLIVRETEFDKTPSKKIKRY